MLHLIRLRMQKQEPTVCNARLAQKAKNYKEAKENGKPLVPFNQQTCRKDDPAFIEWQTNHLPALTESVRKLHADPKRHGAWLEAVQDGARLLHGDNLRQAAWLEAMREGTAALHGDKLRHAAWLASMREGTAALHNDPDRHSAWLAATREATAALHNVPSRMVASQAE